MTDNIHIDLIAQSTGILARFVSNTIKLLTEGNSIPFISRYRKEMTGSLDEVAIGNISKQLDKLRELEKRKQTVVAAIEEQGKMTDALLKRITNCYDTTELEDIYLPYKKKKKTRAMIAVENGLEPLAQLLSKQTNTDIAREATAFITDKVPTAEDALSGARDIIAEWINENEEARQKIRVLFKKSAILSTSLIKGKEAEAQKYKDFFNSSEPLAKCPSHRMLAVRRAEAEGYIRVSISPSMEDAILILERIFVKNNSDSALQVKLALQDSYKRLMEPSIETEFRNLSKEKADEEAIKVFANNLMQLLLQAPLGNKAIMGLDPGFRTGCKLVCLDNNGQLLRNSTIYPHPPQSDTKGAAKEILHLVALFDIEAIAIGNGTAGKESFNFVKNLDFGRPVEIYLVNESGASIYSASEVAREEFPDQDVTVRGSVSIARRLQDPLAELIKIDPKSIGVGQYQHDVDQAELKRSLDQTVINCVNSVGINLNTASKHLLTYVSGVRPVLAKNIIAYRNKAGGFTDRRQLLEVPRLGPAAYEQAAGFLRVVNPENPLDNTAVHPESYHIVEKMAHDLSVSVEDLIGNPVLRKKIDIREYVTEKTGLPTLQDIMKELEKPGLDPRGNASPVDFKDNINSMDDIEVGMVMTGIVTNLTKFGAFVDIGIKQDGLVHISQIADKYIKDPADVLKLNQRVQVKVLEIDRERKRIHLSIKHA